MNPIKAASRFCFAALFAGGLSSTAGAQSASPAYTPPPAAQKQASGVEKRLKVFDALDFDVFSNKKWERVGESHAKDIIVTWHDGHDTHGMATDTQNPKVM